MNEQEYIINTPELAKLKIPAEDFPVFIKGYKAAEKHYREKAEKLKRALCFAPPKERPCNRCRECGVVNRVMLEGDS